MASTPNSPTSDLAEWPLVDVAVTLIERDGRRLAVFNPGWSAFTLPMTKRRRWQDPRTSEATREEEWVDAACRAAAEWLGRTFTTEPEFLTELPEWQQGDRTGEWKRYRFRIYRLMLPAGEDVRPGAVCEWLSTDEWLDPVRRPISTTARHLLSHLRESGHIA